MITLAEMECRLRETRDLSVLDETHLHRAWREDALGRVRGRDRLREAVLASLADEQAGAPTIEARGAEMIAFTTMGGWRGHRWVEREGDRILGETEILDGAARSAALGLDLNDAARAKAANCPMHGPLGELRAGLGQLATSERPALPSGFATTAVEAATALHRIWNGRAINQVPREWRGPREAGEDGAAFVIALLTALPDAVWLPVRGSILDDGRVAVLWRLHGHHLGPGFGGPSTRRVRLIGSSVLSMAEGNIAAEDMLVDTLAMRATAHRPLIDYGPAM